MELINIENDFFKYEHLNENNLQDIRDFKVRDSALGLERYLKEEAFNEEKTNMACTYLVRDKETNEIVLYFSLKAGSIVFRDTNQICHSLPAIELSNFAVNQVYKENNGYIKGLGEYTFFKFIFPIIQKVSQFIGINSLYIYSLPENSLIAYYEKLGFSRLSSENETYINSYIKPNYDNACIFMYQNL